MFGFLRITTALDESKAATRICSVLDRLGSEAAIKRVLDWVWRHYYL